MVAGQKGEWMERTKAAEASITVLLDFNTKFEARPDPGTRAAPAPTTPGKGQRG
jgi:hypothetical protein